jgi:hypothetical protein
MRGIRGVEMAYAWVGWTLAMTGGQSQISARSEEALALHYRQAWQVAPYLSA